MLNPHFGFFRKLNRKTFRKTYEQKSNRIRFGIYGIQAMERGFLTAKQIEAVRRTITNKLKRKGKVWIRAYPNYPRTAKPKEVRMGRGKGNLKDWISIIKPGRILFEVKSKQKFLTYTILKFTQRKIPFRVQIVSKFISIT